MLLVVLSFLCLLWNMLRLEAERCAGLLLCFPLVLPSCTCLISFSAQRGVALRLFSSYSSVSKSYLRLQQITVDWNALCVSDRRCPEIVLHSVWMFLGCFRSSSLVPFFKLAATCLTHFLSEPSSVVCCRQARLPWHGSSLCTHALAKRFVCTSSSLIGVPSGLERLVSSVLHVWHDVT